MAKYNFSTEANQLVVTLVPNSGDVIPRTYSFSQPSVIESLDKIKIYDSGTYKKAFSFEDIGTIGVDTPTDLADAVDLIIALIASASGVLGTQYNTVDAYDEDATLPLVFATGTIHSLSIVAKTGGTTITVNGEETVVIEGQSTTITADGLIVGEVSIDSTTGEFLATTLS